jgi:hypothetical protein
LPLDCNTETLQSAWPQRQITSILVPIFSQWSLQYFFFSGAMQVQLAFAHFFGSDEKPHILLLCRSARHPSDPGTPEYNIGIDASIVAQFCVDLRAKSNRI